MTRSNVPGARVPDVEDQYYTDCFAGYLYLDPAAGMSVIAAATALMRIRMKERKFKIIRVPRSVISELKTRAASRLPKDVNKARAVRAGAYARAREMAEQDA